MKASKYITGLLRFALMLSVGVVLTCWPGGVVWAKAQKKKLVQPLTGEQLYSINCNRCHSERYPMERTDAQWQTLLMHMRVRANLPAEQARKILEYLKENN